jgi:hypothetical protein
MQLTLRPSSLRAAHFSRGYVGGHNYPHLHVAPNLVHSLTEVAGKSVFAV